MPGQHTLPPTHSLISTASVAAPHQSHACGDGIAKVHHARWQRRDPWHGLSVTCMHAEGCKHTGTEPAPTHMNHNSSSFKQHVLGWFGQSTALVHQLHRPRPQPSPLRIKPHKNSATSPPDPVSNIISCFLSRLQRRCGLHEVENRQLPAISHTSKFALRHSGIWKLPTTFGCNSGTEWQTRIRYEPCELKLAPLCVNASATHLAGHGHSRGDCASLI